MYFKRKTLQLIFIITGLGILASCDQKNAPAVVNPKDSLANSQVIIEASKAIENDPENAELYYQRSVSYYNQKYLDRALDDIKDAIRLNEKNPLYQFHLNPPALKAAEKLFTQGL